MDANLLGKMGEDKASAYLESQGYKILKRNFSCRFGEIDIIAENDNYLLFVEVKLRKNNRYGNAAEFVSREKQRKIIKTANFFLLGFRSGLQPRFDVIEVYAPYGKDGSVSLNHIENAFW